MPIPSTPSKHTHCEAVGKQEREQSPTCESTPSSSSFSPTTSKRMNRTCVIMLGDGGVIKRVYLYVEGIKLLTPFEDEGVVYQ